MVKLPFKRIFLTTSLTLLALTVAAWFGGRMWLEGSLMPLQGSELLAGLDGRVDVLFDARGIPRIYAETDADAVRALGWLHASERLFQMELLRKVAAGEISEVVGAAGLESDLMHRHYGFARRIALNPPALDPTTEALLTAYVDGVNARIESGRQLPPAFLLLGHEPARWTTTDVLTLAYYQTWYPTTLVQRMAEAWRDAARAHGAPASRWLQTLPEWGVPSVPATRMTDASNTWVVAPERSESGAALHASDPHLEYDRAPGLWYAAGLHSGETLDVVGVTAPGLPFVAMGHNGRIAFAFTVAPVDLFELYWFERLPDRSDRLRGPDGPLPLIERVEQIQVRGRDEPVERRLLFTPMGPATEIDDQTVEVLHWAGFELPVDSLIEHGLAINRANDFDQFRRAASDMGALSVNWSYSDRAGNIGYVQSTPIPLRMHDNFYRVLDGADPVNHWDGFVAPDARPFALNPQQGWLANANNHAAVDAPWPLPGFYKHMRMRRATDWLSGEYGPGPRFDADDMRAMQLDYTSDRALAWKDWLAETAAATGRDALARELRDWDGVMAAESEAAGLFTLWWQFLPRHLFGDSELETWRHGRTLLDDWLHGPPEGFELAALERDEAARRALEDALRHGVRPLGAVQTLTIEHPLARSDLLNAWLSLRRGPIPIGGDPGSLNVTYHAFDEARVHLRARAGASMRYVMDWADPDRFTLNLTLGQSGHPFSPHFDDQLKDFLAGTPWTVPFSRDEVEARAASRLILRPHSN